MYVLMKGTLATRKKEIVEGPRQESFHELANQLNYDHGEMIRKQLVGEIIDGQFIQKKKYIWFNKEVN